MEQPVSSDLAQYLKDRIELLEKRLETAQNDALRADVILREREEARAQAQREIEELFRGIRQEQRAANFDRLLREQLVATQARVRELEARLQGQPLAPSESSRPAPPTLEQLAFAGEAPETDKLGLVLSRMVELEKRLQEAEEERDRERAARLKWEQDILESLKELPARWRKAGGPELLVEATLESIVESARQRDNVQREMRETLDALQTQEGDVDAQAPLRERLHHAQSKFEEISGCLDQQMALITAWVQRSQKV